MKTEIIEFEVNSEEEMLELIEKLEHGEDIEMLRREKPRRTIKEQEQVNTRYTTNTLENFQEKEKEYAYLELSKNEAALLISEELIPDRQYDYYEGSCYLRIIDVLKLNDILEEIDRALIYSQSEVDEIKLTIPVDASLSAGDPIWEMKEGFARELYTRLKLRLGE